MIPVKTKSTNCVYAENQPEYIPLPVERTPEGMVTSCWKFSFVERFQVLLFGKMFISVMTFNKPLQPIKPFVVDEKLKLPQRRMFYDGTGRFPEGSDSACRSNCVVTKWNVPNKDWGRMTEIRLDNGRYISMPHEQIS